MNDVTQILCAMEGGDSSAADQLLPLVYGELRRLAAQKMAGESADHTLQATALVNEAYIKLVDPIARRTFQGRQHFFAAAAEAMRRILVDHARRRRSQKLGGHLARVPLDDRPDGQTAPPEEILAVHEALEKLEHLNPQAAELIKLRYFAGFTMTEAADALGLARSTAYEIWAYGKSWLRCELDSQGG